MPACRSTGTGCALCYAFWCPARACASVDFGACCCCRCCCPPCAQMLYLDAVGMQRVLRWPPFVSTTPGCRRRSDRIAVLCGQPANIAPNINVKAHALRTAWRFCAALASSLARAWIMYAPLRAWMLRACRALTNRQNRSEHEPKVCVCVRVQPTAAAAAAAPRKRCSCSWCSFVCFAGVLCWSECVCTRVHACALVCMCGAARVVRVCLRPESR